MDCLWVTASSRYPAENLFRKFLKNSLENNLKESFFNDTAYSRPETLQKHNPTVVVFSQILNISQNNFSLKNVVQLPLDGAYSVKKYLQNTSKTLLKISNLCSLYAENLKNISLTGTPHNQEFWENFKGVPEILTLFR